MEKKIISIGYSELSEENKIIFKKIFKYYKYTLFIIFIYSATLVYINGGN